MKIRREAAKLLDSPQGELIIEVDQLASYFSEYVSYSLFLEHVYNSRLRQALERNRVMIKANIRERWFSGNKLKAQENLYRLIATPDELARLKGETDNIESNSTRDPLMDAIDAKDIWSD